MKSIKNKKLHIKKINRNSKIKRGGVIFCKKLKEELEKEKLIKDNYLSERNEIIKKLNIYEKLNLIEELFDFKKTLIKLYPELFEKYKTIILKIQYIILLKSDKVIENLELRKIKIPQNGGLNLLCNKIQKDIKENNLEINKINLQIPHLKKIKEYYEDLFNEIKKFEIEISRVKVSNVEKNPKILELISEYEKICKKVQELEGRKIITNTNNNSEPKKSIANKSKLNTSTYILPVHKPLKLFQKKTRQLPVRTPIQYAKKIREIYNKDYEFPEWVIDEKLWNNFKFDKTKVYYNEGDNLEDVKLMVKKREPVNIGMEQKYNIEELEEEFGYHIGAYSNSTKDKLMPNIAIYCRATVKNPNKEKYVNAHVINLVGYAFDNENQPDYIYFKNKYTNTDNTINIAGFKRELIEKYRKMWMLACHAARDKGLKYLCLYNVGGMAFTTLLNDLIKVNQDNFFYEIFKPSFGFNTNYTDADTPLNFCNNNNIKILHKKLDLDDEKNWRIPNLLFYDSKKLVNIELENTLLVNAWDPWSLIGNGNASDNSLDGFWGRSSNMSVLGWTFTNKYLEKEESYIKISKYVRGVLSEQFENAEKIRKIYTPDYKFPEWVINEDKWNEFYFNETRVYYNEDDNDKELLNNVKLMVKEREPVNIKMNRSYNQTLLFNSFGYNVGAYSNSTKDKLMPNIAIYCRATVKNPNKEKYVNAHVINLVGYAFDNENQPDYIYFKNKYTNTDNTINIAGFKRELIEKYRKMWMLACHAARDKGLKYLYLYDVGGVEFTTLLNDLIKVNQDNFISEIFKPSFYEQESDITISPDQFCKNNNIQIFNDDLKKNFNQTDICNLIYNTNYRSRDYYISNTLLVNSWNPWSLIGNDNYYNINPSNINPSNNSLNNFWEKNSNMSVLGWTFTNKSLEMYHPYYKVLTTKFNPKKTMKKGLFKFNPFKLSSKKKK